MKCALQLQPRRARMALAIAGMDLTTLAQLTDVEPKTIEKYFHDTEDSDILNLARICDVLDVSADFVLGLSDDIKISRRVKK